ncbi:MAG: tRNA (adenosine(37)-N6)-threonylcarbamoyltransferase complex transferase subunit TsaD [Candidatus Omnitrophica bacterium]|nr:tRNA (adenosine(37)-N6)-threonylcarbamoyltransferase complex transferase subunit TsaD [Candidatus Omnitrophota bacterium]
MIVLGIETSCDETAAAIVKDAKTVCSNVVSSSLLFHKKYGGIVPEIAFRKQMETITQVVDCALKDAGIGLEDIDLISVTDGPGLLGSLLVGVSFAKALSYSRNIPLVGVNHLYSHIYAGFLNIGPGNFPFVSLVVSGGHTSLYYVRSLNKISLLGSTQDDACGEAFDKVAKILNLGYPGGPVIEKFAHKGDPRKIKFACSNTRGPLDFSFSGIKTAVLYYVQKNFKSPRVTGYKPQVADICASFQECAINTLVEKSMLACSAKKVRTLVVGGGVAANLTLREKLNKSAAGKKIKVIFPTKEFCMDNAAMVAGLGCWLYKSGRKSNLNLNVCLD